MHHPTKAELRRVSIRLCRKAVRHCKRPQGIVCFLLLGAIAMGAQQRPIDSAATTDSLPSIQAQIAAGDLARADLALRSRLTEAARNGEPQEPAALYLLAYVLFRRNEPRESLKIYTSAAALRPPTADDLVIVASNYILLKSLPDAEHWLRRATEQRPDSSSAWYLLGRTEYNMDHSADATKAFDHCLALNPHDVRAEYNLGLAYERLEQPDAAIAAYKEAIRWQSARAASPGSTSAPPSSALTEDPQPYLDLGTLLLRRGDAAAALPPLSHAAALAPSNPFAQQQLGLTLEHLGRDVEAIAVLRRAAALAPNASAPHFFLGRLLRHLDRTKEAATEFAVVAHLAQTQSATETPNTDH